MAAGETERVRFRFLWTTRISVRRLGPVETIILHVSPKFATVFDCVSFQWSLKMHGSVCTTNANKSDQNEDCDEVYDEIDRCRFSHITLSLYFNDGPVPVVNLRASVSIIDDDAYGMKDENLEITENQKNNNVCMHRGKETELLLSDHSDFSQYIKSKIGRVVRLALLIDMSASLFDPTTYLNSHSPTPFYSFLTVNYRARASSKVFKRRSRSSKRKTSESDKSIEQNSGKHPKKRDYEKIFNKVMDDERAKRELSCERRALAGLDTGNLESGIRSQIGIVQEHLFKKLLIACCDGCERRASITSLERDEETDDSDDENTFECTDQNKEEVHDLLANMYFNKIALPEMEFVEDFADFLIDAELNDLPVLKRACERYLCGELNNKKDIITSLLLDLLFLSIVFNLPVMKSMTLAELSRRTDELMNTDDLLKDETYRNLDRRMKDLSDSNLVELIEEVQRFREQRMRVLVLTS